jgi:nicotinate-nucleotide adenylyltransferase
MSLPGDSFPNEVRLDTRELVRAHSSAYSPTYSYDTLIELQKDFPQLAFVIGADQLASLHTWHRFPELLGLCHWIVLERKPDGSPLARQTLQEWTASGLTRSLQDSTWKISNYSKYLTLVPTHAPFISSTAIRESISRSGTTGEGLLSPTVLAYLKDHRLYGI